MNKLLEIINQVLIGKSEPPIEEIFDQMDLRNDLGLDSLDLAELTVRIEEEFKIDIFENGIVNTIGEIKYKING